MSDPPHLEHRGLIDLSHVTPHVPQAIAMESREGSPARFLSSPHAGHWMSSGICVLSEPDDRLEDDVGMIPPGHVEHVLAGKQCE
jgi:hypothetical protein